MDRDILLAELVDEPPKPWGLWATLGLSLAIAGVAVMVETAVVLVYAAVATHGLPSQLTPQFIKSLGENGLLMSLANWITLPFILGLVVLFVAIRARGSIKDYLAMRPFSPKALFIAVGILAVFMVVYEAAHWLTGMPTEDESMVRACETAWFPPLFWATLVIAAPLGEETFFRGFMFRGIHQSRLGVVGAVLITSLTWSLCHISYGPFEVLWIFFGGILLGAARWKSGSIYLTMALHAIWNLFALVELYWYICAK